jgi:hypothetical protein
MIVLRRFLVLAALMFWQGGFTFYAAVVVPVGQHVLGSHLEQGLITRRVTPYLNLAGTVALLALAWDTAATRDPTVHRRWWRWLAWAGMLLTLGALAWLHPRLDGLLEPHSGRILDRGSFRTGHRWYLWLSTVQWALGIAYGLATLAAWRAEDGAVKQAENDRGSRGEVPAPKAQKKCPAVDPFGVAQSPKSSFSGTLL